jgi:hypothetical protein
MGYIAIDEDLNPKMKVRNSSFHSSNMWYLSNLA